MRLSVLLSRGFFSSLSESELEYEYELDPLLLSLSFLPIAEGGREGERERERETARGSESRPFFVGAELAPPPKAPRRVHCIATFLYFILIGGLSPSTSRLQPRHLFLSVTARRCSPARRCDAAPAPSGRAGRESDAGGGLQKRPTLTTRSPASILFSLTPCTPRWLPRLPALP